MKMSADLRKFYQVFKKIMKTVSMAFEQQFLEKHRIVQVQHPTCSSDLTLWEFFLILKLHLKSKILGRLEH